MTMQTERVRGGKLARKAVGRKPATPKAALPTVKIQDCAVLLNVELSRFHVWRKVSTSEVNVSADAEGQTTEKDAIAVNKEIMKCAELQGIMRLDDEVRRYLYARCLPSPFKRGIYLLPIKLLDEVLAMLQVFQGRRAEMVELFLLVYEQEKTLARKRLAKIYDAADYPAVEAVRQLFAFNTQLMEMSVPATLQTLNAALYQKESAKALAMWDEAKVVVTKTLYGEFVKLVERLSEKLASRTDGKRQIFRDSTVENIQDWLRVFDARNLTDDTQLVAFVDQARALIGGVNADTIREADSLRLKLAGKFDVLGIDIAKRIDELPDRAISFDN